jgi:hypothetical protein
MEEEGEKAVESQREEAQDRGNAKWGFECNRVIGIYTHKVIPKLT